MFKEWNEDSILSRNGYVADGSISEARRHVVLSNIIAKYEEADYFKVINHFRVLIDCRGDRCPNACKIWQNDLSYFCRLINSR